MKARTGIIIASVIFAVLAVTTLFDQMVGFNDDQNWQIKQSLNGKVTVIDQPGWYLKLFATVWTYPRSVQRYFSRDIDGNEGPMKDESIKVTFNDGGLAQFSVMIRYRTPSSEEVRRLAHREFSGSVDNMNHAVRSWLLNCCKTTAPIMSASEHQSARKAEFVQIVYDQLMNGLYGTRKIEKALKDQYDQGGKPITVYATEIICDDNGKPVIAQVSPLTQYGIEVTQFSITETEYDPATQKQFAAKKESFLAAEQSKAKREQEVQERLMIIEKGLREKAEVESIANKEKAAAVIQGQKEKEVAELEAQKKVGIEIQAKLEAETKAEKALSVAKITKQEAETKANMELEVAKIRADAAMKEAEAIKTLAQAEQEKIQIAGAITEKEQVLAQIAAERDVRIAEKLANIKVPEFIINGGGDGKGTDLTTQLMNLKLLESNGLLNKTDLTKVSN